MGVASYRRGSALISRDFARDAYAKGWSSHDPDAIQAATKPRPLDWGSKSDERALDHARRMLSGSRKYGRDVDAEVLALAVADKAKVSLDRAAQVVQIVLAGPDGATKMNPRRRNPDALAAANRKVAEKEAALDAALNAPLPRVFSANDRWPREQAIRKARASYYVAVGERDDLATLQRGGKPTRRNPDTLRTIVLAWIVPDGGVEEYQDGWRVAYRRVPLAKTVIWANEGTTEDEGKARAYAKKEGNEVLIFPTTEKDPHGRAKRETLAAWKAAEAAKEAARVKAEAKARRRKVVNPRGRHNPETDTGEGYQPTRLRDRRNEGVLVAGSANGRLMLRKIEDKHRPWIIVDRQTGGSVQCSDTKSKALTLMNRLAPEFPVAGEREARELAEHQRRETAHAIIESAREHNRKIASGEIVRGPVIAGVQMWHDAERNPGRKNPANSITATLNVPQKTNRGVIIEWTDRTSGVNNEALIGHKVGRGGKPLAGYVCARLFSDGRIGPVLDQRGGIVG